MFQIAAFIKRGLHNQLSYPVSFILRLLSTFTSAATFYFVARLVGSQATNPHLQAYGGDYMAFLVIGVVFQGYVKVAQDSFARAIRNEQRWGTLEFLLLSRSPLCLILGGIGVWSLLQETVSAVLVLSSAVLAFGLQLDVNFLPAALFFVLAILGMTGVGIISAGIIVVTKQGNPVQWFINLLVGLLSGVYYPVEVFPSWLGAIARFLPTTHALIGLRQTLINHTPLNQLREQLLILVIFACISIPLGLLVFRWGFDRAKRDGTLSYY